VGKLRRALESVFGRTTRAWLGRFVGTTELMPRSTCLLPHRFRVHRRAARRRRDSVPGATPLRLCGHQEICYGYDETSWT